MDPTEAQLYTGQLFTGNHGTYRIGTLLASGGFAGVFDALDQASSPVAVKVLAFAGRPANAPAEFQAEIELLRLLAACSNVVTLRDEGSYSTQLTGPGGLVFPVHVPFMVLDRAVTGIDALLANRHQISWLDRMGLYRDLVKGVHQMHNRRLVHRDLKAANGLAFQDKPMGRITDLGRSKNTREQPRYPANAYETGMGDLRFSPPEFLWHLGSTSGESHCRADLYLLGSLFYEFATATGITAAALRNPFAWMAHAASLPDHAAREQDYQSHLGYLRDQYKPIYTLFEAELPRSVAKEGVALLRQLTDPDPAKREPARLRQRLPVRWDLQWLLYRIDIFSRRLEIEAGQAKARSRSFRQRKVTKTP
jgi:serine/threonine protein kinase